MREPSTSLVIETENLKGGGASRDEVGSLERLLRRLAGQTRPLTSLRELVITVDTELDETVKARLERAAGREILFARVASDAGYYGAKNAGFRATTADVVAFGDADCLPAPAWLSRLFEPFAHGARVVAGKTVYRDDVMGRALTAIDFLYFESPLGEGCVRNFYANNVAFERSVFEAHPYRPGQGFYRGECQVLGLELHEAGIPVHFAGGAVTEHRLPDTFAEAVELRLLRGGDALTLAPKLVERLLPSPLSAVGKVPGALPLAVLGGRFLAGVGRLASEGESPARSLAAMTFASCVDVAGAGARVAGLLGTERAQKRVLAYHAA